MSKYHRILEKDIRATEIVDACGVWLGHGSDKRKLIGLISEALAAARNEGRREEFARCNAFLMRVRAVIERGARGALHVIHNKIITFSNAGPPASRGSGEASVETPDGGGALSAPYGLCECTSCGAEYCGGRGPAAYAVTRDGREMRVCTKCDRKADERTRRLLLRDTDSMEPFKEWDAIGALCLVFDAAEQRGAPPDTGKESG